MRKDVLIQVSVFLGCAVLVGLGDAAYRHFAEGITSLDALRQVLREYGTLFLLIAIIVVIITFAYAAWTKMAKRKNR